MNPCSGNQSEPKLTQVNPSEPKWSQINPSESNQIKVNPEEPKCDLVINYKPPWIVINSLEPSCTVRNCLELSWTVMNWYWLSWTVRNCQEMSWIVRGLGGRGSANKCTNYNCVCRAARVCYWLNTMSTSSGGLIPAFLQVGTVASSACPTPGCSSTATTVGPAHPRPGEHAVEKIPVSRYMLPTTHLGCLPG